MKDKLNPKILAVTFTIITLIIDLSGYVWHGLLQQPSILNLIYSGFWSDWTLMLYGLIGSLIFAYVLGYLFAWVYNWSAKNVK